MDWLRNILHSQTETKSYDESNGFIINDIEIPEEVLTNILSFVDITSILNCKLVCSAWDDIIKTNHFWRLKLKRIGKNPKDRYPWYYYYCYFANNLFDRNLLRNECGQDGLAHWSIVANGGEHWTVEQNPVGADPLPDTKEFHGKTSCFATSYETARKFQRIRFRYNRLALQIFNQIRPKIYVSEWYAGRFDAGCRYTLRATLFDRSGKEIADQCQKKEVQQFEGREWHKVELIFEKYPEGLTEIEYYHEGCDTMYWAGHYGSKMTGGCVMILSGF